MHLIRNALGVPMAAHDFFVGRLCHEAWLFMQAVLSTTTVANAVFRL